MQTINFGFLKYDQFVRLFDNLCQQLSIDVSELASVSLLFLEKLTLDDFNNVLRQSRLRPIRSALDLIDCLTQEVNLKLSSGGRSMDFLPKRYEQIIFKRQLLTYQLKPMKLVEIKEARVMSLTFLILNVLNNL